MSPFAEPPFTAAPHRFTVTDFMRLGETGILEPDARVELIDGQIIDMSPIGVRHANMVNLLTHLLVRRAGRKAEVAPQNPLVLDPHGMPQPDLSLIDVTRPRDRHAGPKHVHLVIEVSDSTLNYDLKVKSQHYARTGIREYWVVDVDNDMLWIHRGPQRNGSYRSVKKLGEGETVACGSFPAVRITRRELGWK